MIDSVGVKFAALVPVPADVVIETFPAIAPLGTVAVICVADCTLNDADRLPNFTPLAPPNLVPVIVTELPVIPDAGENESTVGGDGGLTVSVKA